MGCHSQSLPTRRPSHLPLPVPRTPSSPLWEEPGWGTTIYHYQPYPAEYFPLLVTPPPPLLAALVNEVVVMVGSDCVFSLGDVI